MTAHRDRFVLDRLPPRDVLPTLRLDLAGLDDPPQVNAVVELLDRHAGGARAEAPCLVGDATSWTYRATRGLSERIARVLVERMGMVPGNRVMLRAANSPWLAAAWLGVVRAGGIAVTTMPLLRAGEIEAILRKAEISHAICEAGLGDALETAISSTGRDVRVAWLDAKARYGLEGEVDRAVENLAACPTAATDPAILAFTSGSTGVPKATVHTHRDLLAVCDTYSARVLQPEPADRFIGSPPLAFTFGLGGQLLFPLRAGAAAILVGRTAPSELLEAIQRHCATILFTAPTAYRAMLPLLEDAGRLTLRRGVSAGETLPASTWTAWQEATGLRLMDGIGSTEMLHIFIGAPEADTRPGYTGTVVPGYEARIVDEAGDPVDDGREGRLAVRGPTGCRYLDDPRQANYVQRGWNITGDTFVREEDGYFRFAARNDDMIVSSGYNIAGPEVEAALLTHVAVAEAGVVAAPDDERGMIVKAYVVLKPDHPAGPMRVCELQDHVKRTIAPYKYPRAIAFVERLPRTETGKLQRYVLRARAAEEAEAGRKQRA